MLKTGQFIDNNDKTITDTKTDLVWQKDHTGPMSWQDAMDYASKLELAGYRDWRLPTVEELITLIDFGKHEPASTFPNMPGKWFWSSSSYAPIPDHVWQVYFVNGYVYNVGKYYGDYVRCVRREGHWL